MIPDWIVYPAVIIGFIVLLPPTIIVLGALFHVVEWYMGLWVGVMDEIRWWHRRRRLP